MVNRKSIYCTIIGLVLAILLEVLLNQKISIDIPTIIITILVYWTIFLVVLEALLKAIHKENVKNNILDALWPTCGGIAMTSLLIGLSSNMENKSIIIAIFCISFLIFVAVGCYRVGIEKRNKDIEKTE